MAIDLVLRQTLLARQNELNLLIGDNIGRTGEPEGSATTSAPKTVPNIADAMPDASEPSGDPLPPAEAEEPRPTASASLSGLRAPAQANRFAALREMATLSLRDSERSAGDEPPLGARPGDARPNPAMARGFDPAGEAALPDAARPGADDVADARFEQALATLMRRAPSPMPAGWAETRAPPTPETDADDGNRHLDRTAAPTGDAVFDATPTFASVRQPIVTDRVVRDVVEAERAPSPSGASETANASPESLFQAGTVAADAESTAFADRLFAAALTPAASQAMPERAGIIASFILNAAMIPGWPPPRPIEGPPLAALAGLVADPKALSEADKELLLYLASMGFSRKHLQRLLRKIEAAKNKSKLLQAMSMLLTNVAAAATALADEVASLMDEDDGEQTALARMPSGRGRLDLR